MLVTLMADFKSTSPSEAVRTSPHVPHSHGGESAIGGALPAPLGEVPMSSSSSSTSSSSSSSSANSKSSAEPPAPRSTAVEPTKCKRASPPPPAAPAASAAVPEAPRICSVEGYMPSLLNGPAVPVPQQTMFAPQVNTLPLSRSTQHSSISCREMGIRVAQENPEISTRCESYGAAESDEEPHLSSVRTDDSILRNFVLVRLKSTPSQLWSELDSYERRLRQRCLRDRLSRQARDKYDSIVLGVGGGSTGWSSYLRTHEGQKRINHWIDKKVAECLGKWAKR